MKKQTQLKVADSNMAGVGGAEDKAQRLKAAKSEPAWAGAGDNVGIEVRTHLLQLCTVYKAAEKLRRQFRNRTRKEAACATVGYCGHARRKYGAARLLQQRRTKMNTDRRPLVAVTDLACRESQVSGRQEGRLRRQSLAKGEERSVLRR